MDTFVEPDSLHRLEQDRPVVLSVSALSQWMQRADKLGKVSFTHNGQQHEAKILHDQQLMDCSSRIIFPTVSYWVKHVKHMSKLVTEDAWLHDLLNELDDIQEINVDSKDDKVEVEDM